MIFVKQTILHNPPEANGNCMAAVIASILEMPIEEVLPIQNMFELPDWNIVLFCWIRERGWIWRTAPEFQMYYQEGRGLDYIKETLVKDQPYLVSGKTNRFGGEVNHICIYMNGQLVHDPHPDNTGLTTMEFFEVIEKISSK